MMSAANVKQLAIGLCIGAALAASPANATKVIVGVNVVGVDQQMSDQQQDALIEELRRDGVTTVRTALGGHGERYTRFVIQAFRRGIGAIVMVDPNAGAAGQHTAPPDPSMGRRWPTAALSDSDPDGFRKWFAGELAAVEKAGVRITAFELGNELNTPRFNGDFPVPGTKRVLRQSDLNNPNDSEGRALATGYRAYLRVMAVLKEMRDHSQVNKTTPILSSMSGNWAVPDVVRASDSIEFLRQNGLDKLADGYSVHFYPNSDPRLTAAERATALEQSGILAACGRGAKPCWLTEWGLNNPNRSCPIGDAVRTHTVEAERAVFKPYVEQGRLAAVIYYSWSGVPGAKEDPGGIFRCGALTGAGKLALSPM
jgi:hypothetical protein